MKLEAGGGPGLSLDLFVGVKQILGGTGHLSSLGSGLLADGPSLAFLSNASARI